MAISGFLFLSWRIWEIVMTVPVVGMLGSLVHTFVQKNELTPTYILVMFIVSTLALAWELFTVLAYLRARHDALFIAFTDLCFFGAFIAGVVLLKFTAGHSCSAGIVVNRYSYTQSSCNLLEASFAIGIILVISFFVTFVSRKPLIYLQAFRKTIANTLSGFGSSRTSPSPQRRSRGSQARIFTLIKTWITPLREQGRSKEPGLRQPTAQQLRTTTLEE